MSDKATLGLRIGEVRELSYFNKISSDMSDNFNTKNVEMKISFLINGLPEQNKLEINLMLEYRYKFIDKPFVKFFELECLTSFFFDNLDKNTDMIVLGHDVTQLSDGLMTRLLNICIGTLRGFAASKMASLPINLVLPLINPANLIMANKEKIENSVPSETKKKRLTTKKKP